MRQTAVLTIASILSALFMSFHLADDILFKMSPAGLENLFGVLILTVWLYGTLALAERRAGYLIMLGGSLAGLAISVIHMSGAGGVIGGEISESTGAFRFVWTLLALSVTSALSGALSAHALSKLPWRRKP
jgi:hypothetical protein